MAQFIDDHGKYSMTTTTELLDKADDNGRQVSAKKLVETGFLITNRKAVRAETISLIKASNAFLRKAYAEHQAALKAAATAATATPAVETPGKK